MSVFSLQFVLIISFYFFFFFNDTATTEIYTLSLHDALPIYRQGALGSGRDLESRRRRAPRAEHARDRRHLAARELLFPVGSLQFRAQGRAHSFLLQRHASRLPPAGGFGGQDRRREGITDRAADLLSRTRRGERPGAPQMEPRQLQADRDGPVKRR